MTIDGGLIRIGGLSLQPVILEAYQIKTSQLVGPAWLATERFDIQATMAPNATQDQLPSMLRELLTDRFMLNAQRVSREQTVYALVPGQGGLKISEKTSKGTTSSVEPADLRVLSASIVLTKAGEFRLTLAGGDLQITGRPNGMHIRASRISSLAELLSRCSDKLVVDRTNLKGCYQIEFDVIDDRMDDLVTAIVTSPLVANSVSQNP
jgi:uncharacterized protein (TIGR03435 family)